MRRAERRAVSFRFIFRIGDGGKSSRRVRAFTYFRRCVQDELRPRLPQQPERLLFPISQRGCHFAILAFPSAI